MDLVPYIAPEWCHSIVNIPTHYIKLANTPTPIEKWQLPDTPPEFSVSIKRDDLTGSSLGGNKARKLDFLLADALKKNCKHVISYGTLQSNQNRALAAACSQLKLKCHLLVVTQHNQTAGDIAYEGNLLLTSLFGAKIHLLKTAATTPPFPEVPGAMERLAEEIKQATGENSYLINVGTSFDVWGYIQCFQEILNQVGRDGVDDIVIPCGTAVSSAGLAIGNYLMGSPFRCHAISISRDKSHAYTFSCKMLEKLGVTGVLDKELIQCYDQYRAPRYGVSPPHIAEFVAKVAAETGVLLDMTYTGKAVYGLVHLMNNSPEVFKGRRILFINTGAFYSTFTSESKQKLLEYCTSSINEVKD